MNKYYVTIAILVEADDYKDVYKMDFAKELGNYGEDFLIVDVQQFYE